MVQGLGFRGLPRTPSTNSGILGIYSCPFNYHFPCWLLEVGGGQPNLLVIVRYILSAFFM